MDCKKVRELLPAFEAGDFPENKYKDIDNHILSCNSCQRELALLKASWTLLDQVHQVDPPYQFRSRLQERIDALQPAPQRLRLDFFPSAWVNILTGTATVAAALLIGIMSSFSLFARQHPKESSFIGKSLVTFSSPYAPDSFEHYVVLNVLKSDELRGDL